MSLLQVGPYGRLSELVKPCSVLSIKKNVFLCAKSKITLSLAEDVKQKYVFHVLLGRGWVNVDQVNP